MTAPTTQAPPARRPRRARVAVLAVLLLLIGMVLLWYSFVSWQGRSAPVSTGPSPTTTLSPVAAPALTLAPTPSPGGTVGQSPPVVIITTYVPVPTFVNAPVTTNEDSGVLAMVTTASGLLASLAGIVSAVVSVRGSRPR